MDFSEKDAARSKWKLSRKNNQRGRGRSRGRGQPGSTRQATTDLGSNADRYDQEEEGGDGAPPEGPVRKSQGADFALWLSQYSDHGPSFYARHRVNLHEEAGLPPADSKSFQGLSFDLKGLAACLGALPLHAVLRLPPTFEETREIESRELEKAALKVDDGMGGNRENRGAIDSSGEGSIEAEQPATAAPAAPATEPAGPSAPQQQLGVNLSSKASSKTEEETVIKMINPSHDADGDLDDLLQLSKRLNLGGGGGGGGREVAEMGKAVSGSAAADEAAASESLEDWLDAL